MSRTRIIAIFVFLFSLLFVGSTVLTASGQTLDVAVFVPLVADGQGVRSTGGDEVEPRQLNITDKNVTFQVVDTIFSDCQLYGPTRQYYHFADQQAVISISFSGSDVSFTPTITINLFAQDQSAEQVEKWINNQYSDALFADAPEVIYTKVLEEVDYTVTEVNYVERVVGPYGQEYADYQVSYSVNELTVPDQFQLAGFDQLAKVHIRTKDCYVGQAVPRERLLDVSSDDADQFTVDRYFSPCQYGPTQQFFNFGNENAVMVVRFTVDDPDFEPTMVINIFSPELSAEMIGKWINNQHSDGIYADAPEPIYSATLDQESYSITDSELIDQTVGTFGDEYDNYRVQYTVEDVVDSGNFQLTGFNSESIVHIRTKACG